MTADTYLVDFAQSVLRDAVDSNRPRKLAPNEARAILDHIAALDARAKEAETQAGRLQKIIDGCDWYWPGEDTTESASDCWQEVVEAYGEVYEVMRGGIVETMWCAVLPPAPDAETDDNFEICESTAEAARAKLTAEIERRSRIAKGEAPAP